MTVSNEVTFEKKPNALDEAGLLAHRGSAHEEIRRVVVWYCLLQAIAVPAWWVSLFLFPSTKFDYWPQTIGTSALDILMWSDLVTYTGLGIILTGEGVLGATLMGMSWAGFLHLVTAEFFSKREQIPSVFRNATERSPTQNLFVTGLQIMVFWPLILGLFPWLITKLQLATTLPFYQTTWTIVLGAFAFAVASLVNLHTAWIMASFGAGTPFPYDKTNKLVCRGMYQWIRNPMAVTGLAQGASVGVMYGSVFVLVYVLCGGLIWHFLVRPIEEEMLADQFGLEYYEYQDHIGLWIPKFPSKTQRSR